MSCRGSGATTFQVGERIIDYTTTDRASVENRFDIVGNLTIESRRRLLTESGVLLLAVEALSETVRARGNVKAGPSSENPADYAYLLDLVGRGELRSVVDSTYPLEDIVAAHERVDTGHKVDSVIITF